MLFFGDGTYPKLGKMIRQEVANVKTLKPQVYEALVKVVESEEVVAKGLTPGQYPRVRIFHYERDGGRRDVQIGGHHTEEVPGEEDYIFLSQYNVDAYLEYPEQPDWGLPKKIFDTLLHEFVHWGRFRAGKPVLFNGKEAGAAFEEFAFGYKFEESGGGAGPGGGKGRTIRGHVLHYT